MNKKKRRRRKPTARPERMKQLGADILAGTVSGLIGNSKIAELVKARGVEAQTSAPQI